jgi:hypothetical protein
MRSTGKAGAILTGDSAMPELRTFRGINLMKLRDCLDHET